MSRERFEAYRVARGVTWGRPLRIHDLVTSTNDLALEAAQGDMKTGGVFVAREQSQGRGRRGSSWQSPPGENLTFTVLVRYPGLPHIAQPYSLVVGLAVRAAVASRAPELAARFSVKWPNDVYFDDKKLAGVLIESRARAREVALAVGVGLNVLTTDFGPFSDERTSLALILTSQSASDAPSIGPAALAKEELLVDILAELETRTRVFVGAGLAPLRAELRQHDLLSGRALTVDGVRGEGRGIDAEGRLLFAPDEGGAVQAIEAAAIELMRPLSKQP